MASFGYPSSRGRALANRRSIRDGDPAWAEYRKKTQELVLTQENKIVTPTSFSPIR